MTLILPLISDATQYAVSRHEKRLDLSRPCSGLPQDVTVTPQDRWHTVHGLDIRCTTSHYCS
jgi:hypothetical protein